MSYMLFHTIVNFFHIVARKPLSPLGKVVQAPGQSFEADAPPTEQFSILKISEWSRIMFYKSYFLCTAFLLGTLSAAGPSIRNSGKSNSISGYCSISI